MSKLCYRIADRLRNFRKDSRGLEAVQSIMLVAVCALMLIGVKTWYTETLAPIIAQQAEDVANDGTAMSAE